MDSSAHLGREPRSCLCGLSGTLATDRMWGRIRAMGQRSQRGGRSDWQMGQGKPSVRKHMPEALDCAIKEYHADFFMATTQLMVEELWDAIQIRCPMTHAIETLCPGTAKYPVVQWEKVGQP